mmetsp:Transcript_687/g.1934  ORF Transcript_687/g.1934 Transcript_687/m.1934 type:complete len:121 (-) Transcript_687:474-836(-)
MLCSIFGSTITPIVASRTAVLNHPCSSAITFALFASMEIRPCCDCIRACSQHGCSRFVHVYVSAFRFGVVQAPCLCARCSFVQDGNGDPVHSDGYVHALHVDATVQSEMANTTPESCVLN